MKKNMTKKVAAKKVVECADGNGGNPTAAQTLKAEFAAQIAQAIAVTEAEAEELGRKAAARLTAEKSAEAQGDNKVTCIGLDCGRRGELSARTLVVRDSETIQPVCLRCEDAARRANLALLPYGIWQERKDKFAAKVEELRTLDVKATGGNKKEMHECLLDMGEEDLEKAIVVSMAKVTHEIRGVILPNRFALSAFFKTHDSREYYVDPAKELLDRFESAERQMRKQEEHFRRLSDAKRQKFADKGQRRQQGERVRVSQFASIAGGGKFEAQAIIPQGVELGAASLTHSPFVGLDLESTKQ